MEKKTHDSSFQVMPVLSFSAPKVAKVRDRTAERGQPEHEKRSEDFQHRADVGCLRLLRILCSHIRPANVQAERTAKSVAF
jgi:hypothetical protein